MEYDNFLTKFTDNDWQRFFTYLQERRFARDDVLIEEGAIDRTLYILTEGTLEARVSDGGSMRTVQVIEEDTVFGELAFVDGSPRSSSVVAVSEGEAYRLDYAAYQQMSEEHPELALELMNNLTQVLTHRLRTLQRMRTDILRLLQAEIAPA